MIGGVPVTGILYNTSCPGVTPVSDGPLIRGAGPGFGVRISRGSSGMSIATGAAPFTENFASAQLAATARLPSTGLTCRTSVCTPRTSTSIGSGASPRATGLLTCNTRPSPTSRKTIGMGGGGAGGCAVGVAGGGSGLSSAPTDAEKRSAPPPSFTNRTLVARVPTPSVKTLPPMRIGLPSMDLLACATVCCPPRPPPAWTRILARSNDASGTSACRDRANGVTRTATPASAIS
jgi:hypothetical protein